LGALSPQLALNLPLENQATFEQFVVGKNTALVASLREVAANHVHHWPLLIGAAGQGKTHLLNAICHRASKFNRRPILLTAAYLSELSPKVLESLVTVDLLALDDVDQLLGKDRWEQALFHLFNELRSRGSTLVLSSRTEFAKLDFALPDLKTRFAGGMVLRLEPLAEAEAIELLRRRAQAMGIHLEDPVINYVIRRAPRNAAALMGLLARIERASLVAKRRVTVPFLREQFPELRDTR